MGSLNNITEWSVKVTGGANRAQCAVRRAATSKLHDTGLPQKAAEHRDAASAKASDLATQVRHPSLHP